MSGQYDADAPEGSKNLGNQYVSRKDIKWIAVVIIVFGAISVPLYRIMKVQSDETVCTRNMKSIATAIQQYSEIYDQRYPPVFERGENGSPYLYEGRPITWAGQLTLSSGATFKCPAAHKEESVEVNGTSYEANMWSPKAKKLNHIELNYGMLSSLDVRALTDVANQDQTILISETSNHGAGKVYNPTPFALKNGTEVPFDAFTIGYDNSEFRPDDKTKFVTRLAFRNSADGDFTKKSVEGRHKQGTLHVIYADGHKGRIGPERAAVIPGRYDWVVR